MERLSRYGSSGRRFLVAVDTMHAAWFGSFGIGGGIGKPNLLLQRRKGTRSLSRLARNGQAATEAGRSGAKARAATVSLTVPGNPGEGMRGDWKQSLACPQADCWSADDLVS